MKFTFKDDRYRLLYTGTKHDRDFAASVVTVFRKRILLIASAVSEKDLAAMRSAGFEKLKGKRAGQYSMRLNDQWRLILKIEGVGLSKTIEIIEIVDYH